MDMNMRKYAWSIVSFIHVRIIYSLTSWNALFGNIVVTQLVHVSVNGLGLGNRSNLVLRKHIVAGKLLLSIRYIVVLKVGQITQNSAETPERALARSDSILTTIVKLVEIWEAN